MTTAVVKRSPRRLFSAAAARDAGGLALIAAAGLAAFFAFPDDLALLTRILASALFVLSLGLVTGTCGIATLGHAVVYGVAGYAAGFACVSGITDPVVLLFIGMIAGVLAGLVSGAIILRAAGLPQLVLSIALVQLVHEAANKMHWLTGGSDGLAGIVPDPVFRTFAFDLWGRTSYLLALAVVLVVFAILQRVVRSPFGLLCRGIKEDPIRVRAMGVSIFPNLLAMYVISGAVGGTGGALTAITAGVVGLDGVSFEWSAMALVMLVLGGAGSLYGALIGTVAFMSFEHVVSSISPFHWLIVVGALLIALVTALPQGLQEIPARIRRVAQRATTTKAR
jgi:branched-chain amino acid transport system permease protein